jgi:hypothetical protein
MESCHGRRVNGQGCVGELKRAGEKSDPCNSDAVVTVMAKLS